MDSVRLGETGLKVSRLARGWMSYGDPKTAGAHEWSLDDEEAQPFFRQAARLGITFWDTANTYPLGTSDEVVGQGLSRKAILEQVDALLTRLAKDYIDLHQIHRFDPEATVGQPVVSAASPATVRFRRPGQADDMARHVACAQPCTERVSGRTT